MSLLRDRSGACGLTRGLMVLVLLAAAGLMLARGSFAIDSVDIANPAAQRSLDPYLAGLQTELRGVQIERPDSHTSVRTYMNLEARGPGPRFTWLAAGFTNSAKDQHEAVISVPQQGLAGSGLFPLRPSGPRVTSVTVAGAGQVAPLEVPGENAYGLILPAGGTAAVAFEVTGGVPPVTLWQREAYEGRKDYLSFFRGALLGVSILLVAALFALYGFRARTVFPVAGGFGLASTAFMMLEAGHLPVLAAAVGVPDIDLQTVRAVVEGAMAAFLLLLLAALSELHRVARLAGHLLVVAGGLAFAIPIYGFAEPFVASGLARALFAATAVIGFILIMVLWRREEVKAETALLSWGAILLWTFLAAGAALAKEPGPAMTGFMLVGLAGVLVVLCFALAHHAFSQGFLSRHFFREAGRHALALAGARAYVWDWQPEEGELYISPEIGRALAQPADIFEGAAGEAFLEVMHPSDRSAYLAAVEDSAEDGRTPIERQFRLRHGDGSYRWFELRARAITGHGLRAARCIGTLIDVTNAKIAEERLLQDAVYDVVTGLPNRALFIDRLERALEAAAAGGGGSLFVLLVDLDRFKMVNEAMGHEAGDALLSIVGRRLKAETGLTDSLARLPGDKFAVLFHEVPGGRDVEAFAQSLVKAVARPIKLDDQEFFLTASAGIAQYREEQATAEKLMKNAAIALYEAKRQGSQTVELFNPSMVDARAELVILESELRRAIERNEIEVHYQPIARLADMHLAGFEALVRWRHPALGLLSPESFIGLAEETGMIRDIGRVVLNEAGRQLGIWQRAYRPAEPAFVAVNISSSQLIEPSLVDDVKQIINREGLLRGSFKIEVTESLVMQYPERAVQILERFRELGVGLSCDDFGTGYSSLSSLRKLPFDTLKVDRSFIAPEAQDQRAVIILNAIIAMGHSLGLAIVAEGIENQAQVDRLGELDCDYGQGYFIGKPLTAKQVSDALAGLPYAHSSGRTAITWLWERGLKDPPPSPKVQKVTAREIAESQAQQRPAPKPFVPPRPRPPVRGTAPAAEPPAEAAVPELEETPPPEASPELPPETEPYVEAQENAPDEAEAGEEAEGNAGLPHPDEPPLPSPRRRRRPRRIPLLGDPEA
ncbi:putative bifunctional diguanylate cyclase/phosphodiesterase [Aestuariivirga sp.]|uniref:putative bifunctional diguanylate cyclase/phosphodiesterase n=1 Tax=Aestuariivirga sp. TaxID=2650926 RepID=UPI00391D4C80